MKGYGVIHTLWAHRTRLRLSYPTSVTSSLCVYGEQRIQGTRFHATRRTRKHMARRCGAARRGVHARLLRTRSMRAQIYVRLWASL